MALLTLSISVYHVERKRPRVKVSGSACEKLRGQHFMLISKPEQIFLKINTLLRSVREVRSQSKLLIPNWRDRQAQRITTSWIRNP